jgi:hypothetical protein
MYLAAPGGLIHFQVLGGFPICSLSLYQIMQRFSKMSEALLFFSFLSKEGL